MVKNMTINNLSAAAYLSGKLRQGVHNGDLTDYNAANRTSAYGNWIYPGRPRVTDLLKNKNNWPRISLETADNSTIRRLGMQCDLHHNLVQISINIWAPENLTCEINNVATEDHTYTTGTDTYALDSTPISIIGNNIDGTKDGLSYSFAKDTDYNLSDSDHTGRSDSVTWIGDHPDNGTVFTCAYSRRAGGEELVRIIAWDVNKYIRKNWQDWFETDVLLSYYKVISSSPINIENNINRWEIFCSFKYISGDIIQEE